MSLSLIDFKGKQRGNTICWSERWSSLSSANLCPFSQDLDHGYPNLEHWRCHPGSKDLDLEHWRSPLRWRQRRDRRRCDHGGQVWVMTMGREEERPWMSVGCEEKHPRKGKGSGVRREREEVLWVLGFEIGRKGKGLVIGFLFLCK